MIEYRYHPLYLRGIDEFNRAHYFQSHEVWEDLWKGESGSARQFYKGLIQAAVANFAAIADVPSPAHAALDLAIWTARDRIAPEVKKKLGVLVDRHL